ncbi:unnamed protein product [Tilletia caries]|uniref:ER membrane protein SH3 n=1 Tax=Tilletia caries TaxID=13290 RepID=A0A177UR05_9BASI|nr:hypothetical protein CF336_g7184 [Tilletia laevis]KAE8261982.1 hypothetical protein A4X03_0g2808 [Tilletia caries]CAD6981223.1 unnamed protein product [Tilletia controversa]KAE8204123.1 hypothetical protein CF335_g2764 [Tilletia laevis]CAD6883969.1 unnamed protein product [Tilletia caries]
MGGPATAVVVGSTSFLLGTLAMHWTADHLLLWQSPITPDSLLRSYTYYSRSLLPVLNSPPHAVILYGAGLIGSAVTLLKALGGRESNWLFDGASLFLFSSAGLVYYNNALINLRSLPIKWPPLNSSAPPPSPISGTDKIFLSLREIASSHAILAVALVGIILLQSAQYYSERLEERERIEELDAKIQRRIRKRELAVKEGERLRKAVEVAAAGQASGSGTNGQASSSPSTSTTVATNGGASTASVSASTSAKQ